MVRAEEEKPWHRSSSLNRARKAKKRNEAKRQAAVNRVAFGRTKAERERENQDHERALREFDSKRIE